MEVNNPVHELEADKTNGKHNPRVFIYIRGPDSEDGLDISARLTTDSRVIVIERRAAAESWLPGEGGKVGVRGGRETAVFALQIDERGSGRGRRQCRPLARLRAPRRSRSRAAGSARITYVIVGGRPPARTPGLWAAQVALVMEVGARRWPKRMVIVSVLATFVLALVGGS